MMISLLVVAYLGGLAMEIAGLLRMSKKYLQEVRKRDLLTAKSG